MCTHRRSLKSDPSALVHSTQVPDSSCRCARVCVCMCTGVCVCVHRRVCVRLQERESTCTHAQPLPQCKVTQATAQAESVGLREGPRVKSYQTQREDHQR